MRKSLRCTDRVKRFWSQKIDRQHGGQLFCYLLLTIAICYFSIPPPISSQEAIVTLNPNRMKTIDIRQETYDRLLQRTVTFEDLPDTVITRLLNETERGATEPLPPRRDQDVSGAKAGVPPLYGVDPALADINIDNAFDPPSLKHTKVLRAEVDGRQVAKANWSTVRQSLVKIALVQRGYDLRRLLEVCPINAEEGMKTDEGYTHYEDLDVSIQGQDANHTWQAAAALARALGLPVTVWFQWRTKPDAAHPGKRSLLAIDRQRPSHKSAGQWP